MEIDDLDGGAAVVPFAPPDQVTSAPPPTIGRLSDEVLGGRRRDTHVGTENTMSDSRSQLVTGHPYQPATDSETPVLTAARPATVTMPRDASGTGGNLPAARPLVEQALATPSTLGV